MALADIVLNDGQSTPVAHTFTYIGGNNGRVVRSDFAAAAETPTTMTHGHQTRAVKGTSLDSHLLRIDITKLDSDGVTPYRANIRLVADIPKAILSDALCDDLASYIRNWASNANIRGWAKGSVG